ncbi:MAG: primosomal protein N' [Chryseobacterium sp.]|nr:MAG: primosomal protein N' [Chryseobacterium sp.]
MQFAQIILPLNIPGTYTYRVPEVLAERISAGMRAVVQFGGRKLYTGIVAEVHDVAPEAIRPKEIVALLDDFPIMPLQQLQFWQWLSEYYLSNEGEIYRFAFPSSLKLESETYIRRHPDTAIDEGNLEANELMLMQALEVRQLLSLKELEAFIPKKEIFRTLSELIDRRYIIIDEKIAEKYRAREIVYLRISEHIGTDISVQAVLQDLNRSPRQKELFLAMLAASSSGEQSIKKSDIAKNFSSAQIRSLVNKGYLVEVVKKKEHLELYEGEKEQLETLTDAQETALRELETAFGIYQAALLQGPTASGKTHVYAAEIEKVVESGGTVLYLLPEIGVTKQIIGRLEKKYGTTLGFYHAKMSDFERVEIWRKVLSDQLKIIIGTRTALFLPYQKLDLIVIDEEHDNSYRQTHFRPYFHARDAAVMLSRIYGGHALLGSATPAVESVRAVQTEKLGWAKIAERYGKAKFPQIELINFKEEQSLKLTTGSFSQKLIDTINAELEKQRQIIVLHNRRGYANVLECESCGHATFCSNCDVVMTYHKSTNELKCHYCGHRAAKPQQCSACHSENLTTKGVGIQQIEEELRSLFPNAVIDRMDADSMRGRFAYEKLYEKIENGETDIIVGTQMIAKGLDFDRVDLVAVPRADSLLHVSDYRADERAWQLLMQVGGRAGRKSGDGKMMVQTYDPSHAVFQFLGDDSGRIYGYLLDERKKFLYPPFVRTLMIEIRHRKEGKTSRAAQFMGSVLRKYLPEECILGPEKAPLARVNNLYQYQILLKLPKGKQGQLFKELVGKAEEEFRAITAYQSVKLELIVDF